MNFGAVLELKVPLNIVRGDSILGSEDPADSRKERNQAPGPVPRWMAQTSR